MTSLFSERFENILHQVVPPGLSLEPHFRLPEIGCDSLSVARLLHLLHKEGVNISILQLYEYPLSHLSEIVDAASTTPYLSLPVVNKTTSWEAEWQLPTDIVSSKIRIPEDVQKCILVTGSTGFLGPVLVAEIIKQYPPNVKLFCLVRAHTNEEAARRLHKDMVAAGIWDEGYTSRIKVVRGDLAKPKFALSDEDHTEIINNISDIYHSGAWRYSGLAPTNVGGTLSVIRMACEGGFRVHYVSSANVLTDNYVQEDWLPLSSHHLQHKSGYAQTKIVSERLLQAAAQSRNLSVKVYRVSSISGHTCTPFHNSHDWIVYLLRACARVGGVVGDTSVRLNWLPVDFVARAIVEFSRATGTYGQVVNLIGDGPNLRDIFEEMKEVLHLRDMTSSQWRLHIRETIVDQSDGLFHMVDSLSLYQFKVPSTGIVYPTNKIRSHLKTSWPVISKTLIRKYINDIFGTEDSKKGNS